MDHLDPPIDPYTIHMLLGTVIAAHISLLHDRIIAHIQELFFEFYSVLVRTYQPRWSLPIIAPCDKFRV